MDIKDTIAQLQMDCTREGERANEAEGKAARLESDLRIANGELATTRGLLAAARGEWPLELRPMAGERQAADGAAIRSNAAWRELAAVAIRQCGEARAEARDATETRHRQAQAIRSLNADAEALQSELAEAREALADWRGKALAYQEQRDSHARRADRWQRVAEAAEADANRIARQRNAELAAHNELAAFIGELAPVLAALPLAVLASDATEGGKLAKLYLRAELLADETTGERAARYRKESE